MIRLMIDEPLKGSANMAIDQALLKSAAETGVGTLRIYRWQPATVSLGYFQKWEERTQHDASQPCPVVRRASGGGAIVHDQELTYSIAIPSADRWATHNRDLFDTVHQTLIESLEQLGVTGCQIVDTQAVQLHVSKNKGQQPFLCFQRRAVGDVSISGFKVIGSAQRRLDNALLQHGSVLIEQSRHAPELPGICDLRPKSKLTVDLLSETWPACLARQMRWELKNGKLTEEEQHAAELIEATRFDNSSWNQKR